MSKYSQMYLVPKQIFDNFINKSSHQTSGLVKQINNLDVNEGGKVIIHNDGEINRTSGEKTISFENDKVEEPYLNENSQDYQNDESSQSESSKIDKISSTQISPRNQLISNNAASTTATSDPETTIYVLDKDGLKTPKAVSSSKISNLDWVSDQKMAKKTPDIFITSSDVENRKGNKRKFNKKYSAAPSFLKRNLPKFKRYENSKIDKDKMLQESQNLNFVRDNRIMNEKNSTQESQVKVNVISDDDVPMMDNVGSIKKGQKRSADSSIKNISLIGKKRKSADDLRITRKAKKRKSDDLTTNTKKSKNVDLDWIID